MSLYALTALSVFAGFILDCLFGDPLSAAHPVVLMGKLISLLEKKLREVMSRHACILEHRGVGLMQGLLFDQPVGPIINRAIEKGLLLINAGANIIRFVPALVITESDVDQMIEIMESCIED